VLVVQCGSHGKMLGQLDLTIKNKQVTGFSQTLFPVRSKEIKPDHKIADMIEKLRAPYKAELERVIGKTDSLLYRQGTWQSTADNLVADALRARTKQQIAMSEPGRYGATILPGTITVEDVYNLVPTESPVFHMKFSGKDLRNVLEASIDNVVSEDALDQVGSNMIRFSGLAIQVDLRKPYQERVIDLIINGEPVKDEQLYSLAEFNLFLRHNPNAHDVTQTQRIGPHEIIAYIEQQKHVHPEVDRRLTNHHGKILADHDHLHEYAVQTGLDHVDLDNDRVYQFHGKCDDNGYLRLD
jgi:2',3'-cyclic-nucleotide 2'-phosphodiesterase (5'-nucleotidase family)